MNKKEDSCATCGCPKSNHPLITLGDDGYYGTCGVFQGVEDDNRNR